jgi:DNA-binding MarR family transcriptional regulator
MTKAEFEALAEFRSRLRRFLRFSEEVAQAHGITPLQYQLMLQVRGFPGRDWATVGELAERLQAKHHGVVALVSRCEALGLVRRKVSTADQRRVEIRLTPEGERRVTELARVHINEFNALRSILAPQEEELSRP